MSDRVPVNEGAIGEVTLHTSKTASYWKTVGDRCRYLVQHPDPNRVLMVVKILMPNPLIPEEDPTFANVFTEDRQFDMLMPAKDLYPVVGPRLKTYHCAVFHKDSRKFEIICEAPNQEW